MAVEIERKFLVEGDGWRAGAKGAVYRQGYLARGAECSVRVRLSADRAWLTVKGPTAGLRRLEHEYEIPVADAEEMLDRLCAEAIIEKRRYLVEHAGHTWEVDEFHGLNEGLVIAEIELDDERQEVELPDWLGAEVSHDPRYYNSNLAEDPYSRW